MAPPPPSSISFLTSPFECHAQSENGNAFDFIMKEAMYHFLIVYSNVIDMYLLSCVVFDCNLYMCVHNIVSTNVMKIYLYLFTCVIYKH